MYIDRMKMDNYYYKIFNLGTNNVLGCDAFEVIQSFFWNREFIAELQNGVNGCINLTAYAIYAL